MHFRRVTLNHFKMHMIKKTIALLIHTLYYILVYIKYTVYKEATGGDGVGKGEKVLIYTLFLLPSFPNPLTANCFLIHTKSQYLRS